MWLKLNIVSTTVAALCQLQRYFTLSYHHPVSSIQPVGSVIALPSKANREGHLTVWSILGFTKCVTHRTLRVCLQPALPTSPGCPHWTLSSSPSSTLLPTPRPRWWTNTVRRWPATHPYRYVQWARV